MMIDFFVPAHMGVEEAFDAIEDAKAESAKISVRGRKRLRKALPLKEQYAAIRAELLKIAPPPYQSTQAINHLLSRALDAVGEPQTGENFIRAANTLLTAWAVEWMA